MARLELEDENGPTVPHEEVERWEFLVTKYKVMPTIANILQMGRDQGIDPNHLNLFLSMYKARWQQHHHPVTDGDKKKVAFDPSIRSQHPRVFWTLCGIGAIVVLAVILFIRSKFS